MKTAELRKEIKKSLDLVPPDRLPSVADYVTFLSRPTLKQRIADAEQEFVAVKGVNWRKVRRNV